MSDPNSYGQITDAGLASMRADVGEFFHRHGWNEQVTLRGVEHFAVGIGDINPLWINAQYAEKTVWKNPIAPPCYLYSHINGSLLGEKHGVLTVDRWLPGVLGLWADERWSWKREVNVGETISARTCLNDAEIVENSRFGARFVNQVERTEFLSSDTGEIVAENFMTIRRFERSEVTKKSKYSERILASYTREESEKISEAYGNERPRGSVPRPVSSVRVDEAMGAMLKGPLSVSNIIAYLAGAGTSFIFANREHYRFLSDNPTAALLHPDNGILESVEAPHWDSELAKAFSGLPAGYDLGAQRVCWFSHYVTDWMGDSGFLKDLQVKLLKPNLLGDLTTMNGKVAAIDRVAKQVKLEMTATNQLSEVTAIATAIVDLSRWG